MKRLAFLAVAIMMVIPAVTLAQAAAAQPPKPGPEHQKLAALIGNWTSEGELTESPFGPSEKWSAKIKSEWFPGNFAVVRRVEGKGSVTGESVGLEAVTYDPAAKTYTWYGLDSTGWTGFATGSIKGDALQVTWKGQGKDKAYTIRGTLAGLGKDKLHWTVEYSKDGKTWKTFAKAVDTRVKAN